MLTLCVDIGGTHLKMAVVDASGAAVTEPTKGDTPCPAEPAALLAAVQAMAADHGSFDRVSCGFPGVVVEGVTLTAPNLGTSLWREVAWADQLAAALGRPARVANDADIHGLGAIAGRGVELVVTLGTGVGGALFTEGRLVPNLELGHHPFGSHGTYEETLGKPAYEAVGRAEWNRRLADAVATLARVFNYRRLYLGGGHANLIDFELPERVERVDNVLGLLGGVKLWADAP